MSNLVEIAAIFNDAQGSAASHRKNALKLHSLHKEQQNPQQEEAFFHSFLTSLNHILALKKSGDELGNRLMKFVSTYLATSLEKGKAKGIDMAPHERLVENLMRYLLAGLEAKDKNVRARCCILLNGCLDATEELSAETWSLFRVKVSERLFDKEPVVRSAAVLAMSRFQDAFLDDRNTVAVIDLLSDILQHDSHGDVRKAVLVHLTPNERSLPLIVERCRDTDVSVRKYLYAKKLHSVELFSLSTEQRDFLLQSGLLDRDPGVKQACLELIYSNWITKSNSNLIQFLSCLDILNDSKAVEEALMGFFELVPDMFSKYDDTFFIGMTKESAITLRVYAQFVFGKRGLEETQELLPQPGIFAAHLKSFIQALDTMTDEEKINQHFIILEMFKLGELLDLSDEAGRRDLSFLLSEYLLDLSISESQMAAAIRFQRIACQTESEFTLIISEVVNELRDVFESESIQSLQDDIQRLQLSGKDSEDETMSLNTKILANLKCLEIVKNVLTHTEESISANPLLMGCLNELIIPALNNPFVIIQNQGLKCLGLLALTDRTISTDYSTVFLQFYRNSEVVDVKVAALGTLFDLACLYGVEFIRSFSVAAAEDGTLTNTLMEELKKALFDTQYEIQTLAVEGLSKLFFLNLLNDSKVLEGLLFLYFHPSSAENAKLRQCVGFFLQTFSAASADNQALLLPAVIPLIEAFLAIFPIDDRMHRTATFAQQLFYFTDKDNLVQKPAEGSSVRSLHQILAFDLLILTFKYHDSEHAKTLSSLLTKLNLSTVPGEWSQKQLKKCLYIANHLLKGITDKPSVNTIKKFMSILVEHDDQGSEENLTQQDVSELKALMRSIVLDDNNGDE